MFFAGVSDRGAGLVVSHSDVASVDQDIGAGDKTGAWTAQEQDDVGDLTGLANPAEHVLRAEDRFPGSAVACKINYDQSVTGDAVNR